MNYKTIVAVFTLVIFVAIGVLVYILMRSPGHWVPRESQQSMEVLLIAPCVVPLGYSLLQNGHSGDFDFVITEGIDPSRFTTGLSSGVLRVLSARELEKCAGRLSVHLPGSRRKDGWYDFSFECRTRSELVTQGREAGVEVISVSSEQGELQNDSIAISNVFLEKSDASIYISLTTSSTWAPGDTWPERRTYSVTLSPVDR